MVQRYGGSGGGSPPNNNFANRQTLAGSGGSVSGSSAGATSEAGEPNHVGFSPSASVWYSWTAPPAAMSLSTRSAVTSIHCWRSIRLQPRHSHTGSEQR